MAKQTGLGMTVSVDDSSGSAKDISNDIRSVGLSTPYGVQEVTGIDKSAMERLLLIIDGQVTITGVFNTASNMSHDVFKTVPSTRVNRTTLLDYGAASLSMEMLYTNYEVNRSDAGELLWTATGALADGTAPTWGA